MIKLVIFKGENAIQLENDYIKVIVLPRIGGKIASFYHKEKSFESLFQTPANSYGTATLNDCFGDFTPSGFDDCFPTINAGTGTYGNNSITYPDHGEIWYMNFKYDIHDTYVELIGYGTVLPYTFKKVISIKDFDLNISYNITNTGDQIIDNFYTVHSLFNCEEDMIVNFPSSTKEVMNVGPNTYLGENGKIHSYPTTPTLSGETFHLNKIFPSKANKAEKYYDIHPVKSGECSLSYPSRDINITLLYDATKLPYVGFYVSERESAYNCALEPTNGFYDGMDIAKQNKRYHQLLPNDTFAFDLTFKFS